MKKQHVLFLGLTFLMLLMAACQTQDGGGELNIFSNPAPALAEAAAIEALTEVQVQATQQALDQNQETFDGTNPFVLEDLEAMSDADTSAHVNETAAFSENKIAFNGTLWTWLGILVIGTVAIWLGTAAFRSFWWNIVDAIKGITSPSTQKLASGATAITPSPVRMLEAPERAVEETVVVTPNGLGSFKTGESASPAAIKGETQIGVVRELAGVAEKGQVTSTVIEGLRLAGDFVMEQLEGGDENVVEEEETKKRLPMTANHREALGLTQQPPAPPHNPGK